MRVLKRNGTYEPADLTKIVKAIDRCCEGLDDVDSIRIAMKTIGGLVDGTSTRAPGRTVHPDRCLFYGR